MFSKEILRNTSKQPNDQNVIEKFFWKTINKQILIKEYKRDAKSQIREEISNKKKINGHAIQGLK